MKILLTGATGYIGSQLAKRLVQEGHDLSIIVRPESRLDALNEFLPQVNVHLYDGNYSSMLNALKASELEVVCHVASLFLAQHKVEDVSRLIASNINFPTQLLEAMSQIGVKQIINTGTSWQHYCNETYNPVNLYAATKQALESILTYYVEAHGFKAINLKLFDTYGPGDTRPKLFSLLRKAIHSKETIKMSPGEQLLDMVYIDDVVEAYLLAINLLPSVNRSESYALSSNARISLRELVKIYSAIVRQDIQIDWGAQPYRFREVLVPWSDFKLMPMWKPKVGLQEGIKRMEQDRCINGLLLSSH